MDITKFYPSIDHNILKSIISRKIKDTKVLEILYEIIDSVNGINGIYGKGVPIGNYLSQYFANLYLTGFDHWCKEELKCRYYYRYADDIVILGESKAHLRNVLVAIKLYLKHVLKLGVKDLVNTVSSYFGVDIPILASIAGMSLIPLIFMYISSYVFKFCEYHRMFLHYIAVNDIINIYDWYIGISVTNRELFVLHMSITGISLFIILYLYVICSYGNYHAIN